MQKAQLGYYVVGEYNGNHRLGVRWCNLVHAASLFQRLQQNVRSVCLCVICCHALGETSNARRGMPSRGG